MTNNTFTGAGGDHLNTATTNTATLNIVFTGNLYSNGFPPRLRAASPSRVATSFQQAQRQLTSTSPTTAQPLTRLSATSRAAPSTSIRGTATDTAGPVSNNFIGNGAVANSGSAQSSGIRVENHAPTGTLTAIVSGNTIRQ